MRREVVLYRIGVFVAVAFASGTANAEAPASAMKRYTFEETLQRALARNPSALTAQQEIHRAEAIVREVRAGSLPTLIGNGVGTRLDANRTLNNNIIQNASTLSANVTLSVPLVTAQRWMQWVNATDQAEIARVSAEDVRRTVAIASARAYLAVVNQHRTLEVNDRAFRTAKAHYEFAHGRFAGGVGTRLDEVRALQEQETTRAQAELSRSALVRAQEALGVLLAEDGPADTAGDARLALPPSLQDAEREAAGRRTDVRTIDARAAAAKRVAGEYWADYLPSLTGIFQPFYQNPPTLTTPRSGWQAQLVLTFPFYDGGFRYGVQHEREALASESQLALEASLRQVQSEVRASFEALRRVDAALVAAQSSATLAQEALALANQAYAAGATTNLDVIDAERRARDAETSAAIAEDGARQARLDLLAAAGRFP